jgi:NhaP-type Na+/H+ or K+/H+ antiporter
LVASILILMPCWVWCMYLLSKIDWSPRNRRMAAKIIGIGGLVTCVLGTLLLVSTLFSDSGNVLYSLLAAFGSLFVSIGGFRWLGELRDALMPSAVAHLQDVFQ